MTAPFLACPNKPPCPHPSLIHDIYEPGDPYPDQHTAVFGRLADDPNGAR